MTTHHTTTVRSNSSRLSVPHTNTRPFRDIRQTATFGSAQTSSHKAAIPDTVPIVRTHRPSRVHAATSYSHRSRFIRYKKQTERLSTAQSLTEPLTKKTYTAFILDRHRVTLVSKRNAKSIQAINICCKKQLHQDRNFLNFASEYFERSFSFNVQIFVKEKCG